MSNALLPHRPDSTLTTLALGFALLASCALPKMAVKPDMVPQEPFGMPIFGSGSSVHFGPFQVKDVDRGFFESSGVTTSTPLLWPDWVNSLGTAESHQDYAFALEEAGQPPRPVRCRAEMSAGKAGLGGWMSITSITQVLHCALGTNLDSAVPARLDFVNGKGTITAGSLTLYLEARDMRGHRSALSPAGYAISDGARDLAVAQSGVAAWLAKDLDPRTRALAATATAALLLYRPPDTH